jgi:hypothetical protein
LQAQILPETNTAFGSKIEVPSPCPQGLPRFRGGPASTTSLPGPARASLAIRPARLLAHLKWAFSEVSSPISHAVRPLGSYHVNPHLHRWDLPPVV